jgi:high affinity Mn2+ porin
MANDSDALQLAHSTGSAPDVAHVRKYQGRPGAVFNLEQELARDLGAFVRARVNDGTKEAYEFTEINRSTAAGFSLKGQSWGRNDDALGFAAAVNGLSADARAYLAAGGMGILIGDGALNHGPEKILESYYSLQLNPMQRSRLIFSTCAIPLATATAGRSTSGRSGFMYSSDRVTVGRR